MHDMSCKLIHSLQRHAETSVDPSTPRQHFATFLWSLITSFWDGEVYQWDSWLHAAWHWAFSLACPKELGQAQLAQTQDQQSASNRQRLQHNRFSKMRAYILRLSVDRSGKLLLGHTLALCVFDRHSRSSNGLTDARNTSARCHCSSRKRKNQSCRDLLSADLLWGLRGVISVKLGNTLMIGSYESKA